MELLAVAARHVGGEVELEAVGAQDGIVGPVAAAAQDRLETGDELPRAERLGDVVVGAGLERADLLVLVVDGGQDEDRCVGPLAQAAGDLDPVAIGQDDVDDRHVRRVQRGGVERLLRRRRRDDLEAGIAQHDAQRPEDLSLVVADEDATAHAASTGSRSGTSRGISTTKLVACPGSDSAHTLPPLASRNPRAMARPRPDPRWPVRSVPAR